MPSIDQNTDNIPSMTNSVEVFSTLRANEESKESDEESLHLHLDEDEETEARTEERVKTPIETEDDILNKFDSDCSNKSVGSTEEDQTNPNEGGGEEKNKKDAEEKEENNEVKEKDKQETSADEEMKETEDSMKDTDGSTKENTDDSSKDEDSTTTIATTEEIQNSPKVDEEKVDDKGQEIIADKNSEEKVDKEEDKCENDTEEDLLDVSRIRDAEEDNADNVSNEECDEDMNDKIDNDESNNDNSNSNNNKNDEVEIEETNLEINCNEEDKSKETNDETDDKNKDSSNDKNDKNKTNDIQDEEMKDDTHVSLSVMVSSPTICNENRNSSKRSLDNLDDSNNDSSGDSNVIKRQRLEENLEIAKDKLSDNNNNNNKESQRPIVLQSIEYFKDFMKKKDYKISVYDLEELCLQKTSEVIQYSSRLGDTRHKLQLQEKLVDSLRKDLQQVMKQARDLDIVNKKLMADLKQHMITLSTATTTTTTAATTTAATTTTTEAATTGKTDTTSTVTTTALPSPAKPLQPLKITRSVGLQVRFTPGVDAVTAVAAKRRQSFVLTSQKLPVISLATNKNQKSNNSVTPSRQQAVIQQTATTNHSSPILTQALTSRAVLNDSNNKLPVQGAATRSRNSTGAIAAVALPPTTTTTTATGGTTSTTTTTTTTSSIIDLTDEDDKQNKRPSTTTIAATTTTTTAQNRNIVARSSLPLRQNNQIQSVRAVQSNIRLTQTTTTKQVNNSIGATPTTKHSMYFVQSISPTLLTSSITNAAKVVLSLQQQSGVLNGSTVSVIQKPTPSIQVKPVHALKAPPTTGVVNGTNSSSNNNISNGNSGLNNKRLTNQHPAPLPLPPLPPPSSNKFDKHLKPIPPKPHLSIRKTDTGIILQWRMPYELDMYEVIASYQLFAYQETNATPDTDMWRRVGDVKALALPMACTLTQFADNNKYYFAVRPVDIHKRIGAFSDPEEISL